MVKLFIGNLPGDSVTNDDIRPLFEAYGTVTECEVIRNYGFVHIDSDEGAERAIKDLNGHDVKGRPMKVEKSESKGPKKPSQKMFIGNVADGTTDEQLRGLFESYCEVLEADVISGKNYGFVHIDSSVGKGKIGQIIKELNGYELNGAKIRVQLSTSGLRPMPGMAGNSCFRCGHGGHWSMECPWDAMGRGGMRGGMRGRGGPPMMMMDRGRGGFRGRGRGGPGGPGGRGGRGGYPGGDGFRGGRNAPYPPPRSNYTDFAEDTYDTRGSGGGPMRGPDPYGPSGGYGGGYGKRGGGYGGEGDMYSRRSPARITSADDRRKTRNQQPPPLMSIQTLRSGDGFTSQLTNSPTVNRRPAATTASKQRQQTAATARFAEPAAYCRQATTAGRNVDCRQVATAGYDEYVTVNHRQKATAGFTEHVASHRQATVGHTMDRRQVATAGYTECITVNHCQATSSGYTEHTTVYHRQATTAGFSGQPLADSDHAYYPTDDFPPTAGYPPAIGKGSSRHDFKSSKSTEAVKKADVQSNSSVSAPTFQGNRRISHILADFRNIGDFYRSLSLIRALSLFFSMIIFRLYFSINIFRLHFSRKVYRLNHPMNYALKRAPDYEVS